MEKKCYICNTEITRFEEKVVMFDHISIICSGWVCKKCGEITFGPDESRRISKELKEVH